MARASNKKPNKLALGPEGPGRSAGPASSDARSGHRAGLHALQPLHAGVITRSLPGLLAACLPALAAMRIVFITLEFTAGTFSGNGVYATSQVGQRAPAHLAAGLLPGAQVPA